MSKHAAYFAQVSPTYIENWPPALCELSIPQIGIALSLEEVRDLNGRIHGYKHGFSTDQYGVTSPVKQAIESALITFPNGAFIRLGSRSAKDSLHALSRGLRVTNVQDALRMLTASSLRVAFDLRLALRMAYQPYIFVREWIEIPPWAEFRCFMNEHKLVGISQYDYKNLGHCPEIALNEAPIRSAIDQFFERFKETSHLDNVIFDVFVDVKGSRSNEIFPIKLLEINPYCTKTDACLFNWSSDNDFDGSFRFL